MNLIMRSLQLDAEFVRLPLSKREIIDFLIKKYLLIIKNFLFRYKIGKSHIKIFRHNYYYYDKFGIAFLESVIVENRYLASYIKPNTQVVDVGAHVGEFNIFCKKILKTDKIISIEPIRESYVLLQKNTSQKTFNYAISTKKVVTMYTPDTTIMSSSLKGNIYQAKEKCHGVYLDNLEEIQKLKNIDLLKIDVEGGEYDVLRTAKETLKKTKYLFVEVSIQRLSTGDLFDVLRIIKNSCPKSEIRHIGKPFIISGNPICVDMLIKCS